VNIEVAVDVFCVVSMKTKLQGLLTV